MTLEQCGHSFRRLSGPGFNNIATSPAHCSIRAAIAYFTKYRARFPRTKLGKPRVDRAHITATVGRFYHARRNSLSLVSHADPQTYDKYHKIRHLPETR